jgi:hypothetical protein
MRNPLAFRGKETELRYEECAETVDDDVSNTYFSLTFQSLQWRSDVSFSAYFT